MYERKARIYGKDELYEILPQMVISAALGELTYPFALDKSVSSG